MYIHTKQLVQYSFLAMILLIQSCSQCEKANNKPLEWDVTGNLFRSNVFINNQSNQWLQSLKINVGANSAFGSSDFSNSKAVIVVESNREINPSTGSTKLAQAVLSWIETFPLLPGNFLPVGLFDINGNAMPTPLAMEEGRFMIIRFLNRLGIADPAMTVGFYYAVAPKASHVETLEKTKGLLATLYYDMLVCAQQAGMEHIVMHAISSGVLANGGQEKAGSKNKFTREEFVKITFEGMKEGIAKFQKENPNHALRIILNNWDKLQDQKDSDIGKGVIKGVKHL